MIGEVLATLEVIEVVIDHADLALELVKKLRAMLRGGESAAPNLEAMRGLSAGMAAARANAVQEFHRRQLRPVAGAPTPKQRAALLLAYLAMTEDHDARLGSAEAAFAAQDEDGFRRGRRP